MMMIGVVLLILDELYTLTYFVFSLVGIETVMAYGSRILIGHEKGYCVTRKELLAEFMMNFR